MSYIPGFRAAVSEQVQELRAQSAFARMSHDQLLTVYTEGQARVLAYGMLGAQRLLRELGVGTEFSLTAFYDGMKRTWNVWDFSTAEAWHGPDSGETTQKTFVTDEGQIIECDEPENRITVDAESRTIVVDGRVAMVGEGPAGHSARLQDAIRHLRVVEKIVTLGVAQRQLEAEASSAHYGFGF